MRGEKKPKILLIWPPSTVYFEDPTVPANTPPLGLAYIASFLEKNGYSPKIIDAVSENGAKKRENKESIVYGLTDEEIKEEILNFKPDIVGISCAYTAYAGDAHRMAKIVKEYKKDVPVVFGGAHSSIFPKLTLKDKNVDVVALGEGEIVFLNLVKRLNKDNFFKTLGIIYKEKNKIIKNKSQKFIQDLDSIPFPAWHLLPMKTYIERSDASYAMRKPGMVMVSSRGCPGKCIYCSIHAVWGNSWRGRSPKSVVDEMEKLSRDYGVREFYFMDDSMGVSKLRLKNICKDIINRELDIRWTTPNGIAHWSLDEEILDLMKKAGCYRITFGIESGNQKMRRFIGKPYPLSQAKDMIDYANKIGMWTICTNILGFPEETRQEMQDTIDFAIRSNTDLAIFYLLCPHPGTKAYEIFKELKLLDYDYVFSPKSLTPEKFSEIGKALSGRGARTKHFNQDELQEILSFAYSSFMKTRVKNFLNPKRLIQKINSPEDFFYVLKIIKEGIATILRSLSSGKFASQVFRRELESTADKN